MKRSMLLHYMSSIKGNMLGLTRKVTSRRFLATTPQFKSEVRANPRSFAKARKLIDLHYSKLLQGKAVSDKALGVRISPATEGPHKGRNNLIALRVDAMGRSFFVKEDLSNPTALLKRYARAERLVRLLGNEFRGFKLVVVKPHLVYSRKTPDSTVSRTMIVTDYIFGKGVSLVDEYKGRDFRDLRVAIEELSNKFSSLDIHESSGINSFYNERNKTIYLFDV